MDTQTRTRTRRSTSTSTSTGKDNSVSTLGWDSVYMASFAVINQAIMAQKTYPKDFNFSVDGVTITGKWKSWQLAIGGAGQDVQLVCVVDSGTAGFDKERGNLAETSIIIQVNLKKVAATEPVKDPTGVPGTGTSHALMVDTFGKGNDPAVSIINATFPASVPALLKDLLPTIFGKYFNEAIAQFNHIFAIMNLNVVADQDAFKWLKPSAFAYAVSSPNQATLDNSAFGLMAMVQGRKIGPEQQYAIDSRAMFDLPKGSNSAFVISEQMVASNILLPGAVAVIQGSKASDFTFSVDGLTVTNVGDLIWGHFQTDKNGIISPLIPKNNFRLRADGTDIWIEIDNAVYSPSAGITVHMNLDQHFAFNAVKAKDGRFVFVPDTTGLGLPNISSNVSLSEGLQITEIVFSVVAAVAGLLTIGSAAFAKLLATGIEVGMEAGENTANLVLDAETIISVAENAPEETTTLLKTSAQEADAATTAGASFIQKSGAIFMSSQFRLATGIITAVTGAIAGGIGAAQAIDALDYDKLPPFDDFAKNCLGASAWTNIKNYELKGAYLRTSLVMGIELKQ